MNALVGGGMQRPLDASNCCNGVGAERPGNTLDAAVGGTDIHDCDALLPNRLPGSGCLTSLPLLALLTIEGCFVLPGRVTANEEAEAATEGFDEAIGASGFDSVRLSCDVRG